MAVMTLHALLDGIAVVANGDDRSIVGLSDDSRNVGRGQVFLAYPGYCSDGRDYIDAAISAGAIAVVYDSKNFDPLSVSSPVPMVAIDALQSQVGSIAARFFRYPSKDMNIYAVTGTNGKTSVSHFLAQALHGVRPVGVMGTLGNGLWGSLAGSPLTTQSALNVQKMLMQMRADGVADVVVEASSHGLAQNRLSATQVNTAIFTNLSQDHLDYHHTMANYAAAKRRLFEVEGLKHAVINVYDAYGAQVANSLPANVELYSYGLGGMGGSESVKPMVRGCIKKSSLSGIEIDIESPHGNATLASSILGGFNAENLLAVLAAMLANGVDFTEALEKLSLTHPVVGRMERFTKEGHAQVFVDYAHTPAALDLALAEIKRCCHGRVYVVFGCGGERDKTKRAQMGEIAQKYADVVVVTDDNPRNESAQAIVDDILLGVTADDSVHVVRDRAKAILFCLEQAKKEDVVLIAGKGHEDYQLIGNERLAFSDRELVREFMAQAA
ncbi:MAG: UDP-N-acetylmuramoyl-L-alanyl-D-glutamate--2,6-diaminopimelate ligase [Gammaproteobacteria bacterium]|nr:UDP-N-acetylmuramoyl-L-alanyl-D-glutamate--2,6-diaminopimelate ligase [Gammaproteobacteria bacterium]PCH62466.1 MAG: UDP-N-acetylmuramoyl-L-alanyl-D-glutamate--2,6-diaminopimelate ligase [Gammaproteobacteria bacterium]